MRVGILGGGISGLMAAWLLEEEHTVTLLEKAPRLGGHVETVSVDVVGHTVDAEMGARFFFDEGYPHLLALLRVLGVPIRWNEAGASVTDVAYGRTLVLPPRSARHLASLLRSPRHLRHLLSLRRLIQEQDGVAAKRDATVTFRDYLRRGRYPGHFGPEFAFPFLAACWGAPVDAIPDFPVYSLLKGMPSGRRPGFYDIPGGMGRYVAALVAELGRTTVACGAGARGIERGRDFRIQDDRGEHHTFDALVVATSSRDAAQLLRGVRGASELQKAVGSFRHFDVQIVLHGDRALMPKDPRDWSHSNLFFEGSRAWMSDWPGHREGAPVFRTWLPPGRPLPAPLYARRTFHHLLMSPENTVLQRRIAALQGKGGVWVTGMYAADVDNHESAILSAIVPALALAPRSANLKRLLNAVSAEARHGLDVLPVPLVEEVRTPPLERDATRARPPPAAYPRPR